MSVTTRHGQARFAGAVYLIVVLTGIFSLAYAPEIVFAGASDAEVAQSVVAHAQLLRWSIAAELTCYTAFIVLPLALFRLLEGVGPMAALLMAGFALSSVPFGYANSLNLLEILRLAEGDAAASAPAIAALLDRYRSGLFVQSIPWGLWLIPLGVLVFRSGFLPRFLGVLLVLAGIGYVANFLGRLLFDGYDETGLSQIFRAPRVAEILTCAWLLIFGARRDLFSRKPAATVLSS